MNLAGFPHSDIFGSRVDMHLPEAFRSYPRPSSPPSAKASTVCSSKLDQSRGPGCSEAAATPLRSALLHCARRLRDACGGGWPDREERQKTTFGRFSNLDCRRRSAHQQMHLVMPKRCFAALRRSVRATTRFGPHGCEIKLTSAWTQKAIRLPRIDSPHSRRSPVEGDPPGTGGTSFRWRIWWGMVELDGIEPTTSGLQSPRSPS